MSGGVCSRTVTQTNFKLEKKERKKEREDKKEEENISLKNYNT